MQMLNPSYADKLSSFFATAKAVLSRVKLGRCLAFFIIFMSLLITFGNRGFVDNYMMKEKLAAVVKSNQDIALENRDLKKTIALLRNDLTYIEMVARNELGMVRVGDLVYRYAE
jgi:cell division protein FtsB